MVRQKWVNIGSGNGLLPDVTKPLPEPVLTYQQWGIVAFHLRAISRKILKKSILDMGFEIIDLRLQLHLPEANELCLQY